MKPDFDRVKTIILWGVNPPVSLVRLWTDIKRALDRGVKLVVIDPVQTQAAKSADIHLSIKPGADGYLALAFIKYGLEEAGLKPPVNAIGFEALKKESIGWSYADLLNQAGVTEADFYKAVQTITKDKPVWIKAGSGLELHPAGVQTIRAVASFQSLLDPDHLPRPKSASLNPLPGRQGYPDCPSPIGYDANCLFTEVFHEGQSMHLIRSILDEQPYAIKCMLIAGANPVMTFPAPTRMTEAFGKLDFLAVFDLFMTPTARCADLVLPAASHLETLELHDYGEAGPPYLGLVRPVADSGNRRPLWRIIFDLAERLGLKDLFPWDHNRDAIAYRLAGSGVTFDDIDGSPVALASYAPTPAPKTSWRTSPGEVHFYSQKLADAGLISVLDPDTFRLPFYPDTQYPFYLATGDRLPNLHHSQYRNIPSFQSKCPGPQLEIHPQAAKELGIVDGDSVSIITRHGGIQAPVHLTTTVRLDLIRLSHGWEEANANELGGLDHLDPVSGFPWLKALPARIEKDAPVHHG